MRSFPGKVEASKRVELAFQVGGVLEKLPDNIKEGQKIAKGELIAQLRQDEFKARLQALQGQLDQARAAFRALKAGDRPEQRLRLEANVRAAEAKLSNARTEFERAQRLVERQTISQIEYGVAVTNYKVAQEDHKAAVQSLEKGTIAREEDIEAKEAEIRGLEGRVVEAKIQLDDSTLRAPYDGVIAKRFVEPKQKIVALEPVVKFQNVDEIEVAVDVPETVMAADLRTADIVKLVAEFSGAPGLQFPVQIKEIAQRADPVTQTFRVRVGMKSPDDVKLLPGMTASVTLSYRRAAILGDRILVPITAVFKDAKGDQVAWVIGPDQTATSRRVKLGEASGGRIEILEGLQPGDRIAVAGVTLLREGMKVRDLGDALGGEQS
ncbi:MAG TPA: efflux RND transporter periplasmic adaptor subunit [Gemmataceae bacterium]|nr:efflux RND transporter periplasmic adaptor subunit [Gemmataceae bacterium]